MMEWIYYLDGIRLNFENFNGHNMDINFGFHFPYQDLSEKTNSVLFFKAPKALPNYSNVVSVFPLMVWLVLAMTCAAFVFTFNAIVSVYQRESHSRYYLVKRVKKWDVTLKIVGTLTEPDSLDIFPTWSTGKH